jgi:hypothetical protein
MPILSAAVAVVGALCLLDLLLIFGVIRRLREHSGLLAGVSGHSDPRPAVIGLVEGDSPAAFSATTTTGVLVTETSVLRIAAFFSSFCPACPGKVPEFADYVARYGISRDAVLAVVHHDSGPLPPYLDQLAKACQVLVESPGGPVGEAFQVSGYPGFCVLDGHGTVVVSGYDPSVLSVAASATPAAQPAGAG